MTAHHLDWVMAGSSYFRGRRGSQTEDAFSSDTVFPRPPSLRNTFCVTLMGEGAWGVRAFPALRSNGIGSLLAEGAIAEGRGAFPRELHTGGCLPEPAALG